MIKSVVNKNDLNLHHIRRMNTYFYYTLPTKKIIFSVGNVLIFNVLL